MAMSFQLFLIPRRQLPRMEKHLGGGNTIVVEKIPIKSSSVWNKEIWIELGKSGRCHETGFDAALEKKLHLHLWFDCCLVVTRHTGVVHRVC